MNILRSYCGSDPRSLCTWMFAVLISWALANVCSSPLMSQEKAASKRPFTVRDSIELSQIVNPAPSTTPGTPDEPPVAVPIYSPDHRHFLVVTLRGELSTNTLLGTVWLFNFDEVSDYLSHTRTTRPEP